MASAQAQAGPRRFFFNSFCLNFVSEKSHPRRTLAEKHRLVRLVAAVGRPAARTSPALPSRRAPPTRRTSADGALEIVASGVGASGPPPLDLLPRPVHPSALAPLSHRIEVEPAEDPPHPPSPLPQFGQFLIRCLQASVFNALTKKRCKSLTGSQRNPYTERPPSPSSAAPCSAPCP